MSTQDSNKVQDLFREAYNQGEELIPDYQYDALIEPDEAELDEHRPGSDLIVHMYPMLSLPTFFMNIEWMTIEELFKTTKLPKSSRYDISLKLDGISLTADFERLTDNSLRLINVLTRGKRTSGYSVSKPIFDLVAKTLSPLQSMVDMLPDNFSIRGELVIAYTDWFICNDYLKNQNLPTYKNPRSMVAGVVNADNPLQYIVDKLQFIAHGFEGREGYHMDVLKELDIRTTPHIACFDRSQFIALCKSMYTEAKQYLIPCDGIVIQHSIEHRNDSRVYLDRIAIKDKDADELTEETKVTKIEWRQNSNGSLFPRVHYMPVIIDGSECKHASGHCLYFLTSQGIGVDSTINITKRGGVIPYISKVLSKSNNYDIPEHAIEWQPGDVQLWSKNSEDAIQRVKFIRGMQALDLKDCGVVQFSTLYDAGFKTIFDLEAFKNGGNILLERNLPTNATYLNLGNRIKERLETFNYVWLIFALREPGIGFTIAEKIGCYLSGYDIGIAKGAGKTVIAEFLKNTELIDKIKAFSQPVAPEHVPGHKQVPENVIKVAMAGRPPKLTKEAFAKQYFLQNMIATEVKDADILLIEEGYHSNTVAVAEKRGLPIIKYITIINEGWTEL